MGATAFVTKTYKAPSPQDAFEKAVIEALEELPDISWMGSSGTISEKQEYGFIMIPLKEGIDPKKYAWELIDSVDLRIDSKHGPAGCFELTKGEEYMFFGWSPS
jgi:hypothetical protein